MMSHRLAYGLTVGAIGGPDLASAPAHSLTVADFAVERNLTELLTPVSLKGSFKLEA